MIDVDWYMQYDVFKRYNASSPIEWMRNLVVSTSPSDSTVRSDTSDLQVCEIWKVETDKIVKSSC